MIRLPRQSDRSTKCPGEIAMDSTSRRHFLSATLRAPVLFAIGVSAASTAAAEIPARVQKDLSEQTWADAQIQELILPVRGVKSIDDPGMQGPSPEHRETLHQGKTL